MDISREVEIQRDHYAETAREYHEECVPQGDEHLVGLTFLVAAVDCFGYESALDIGSGTGRALSYIKSNRPGLKVIGIEPVKEMREIGYESGLSREELIEGDATRIQFGDGEFDVVCAFGVLHHIRHASVAVSEMLRVASKAVFISDSNNFGDGGLLSRSIKQAINALGLWKVADYINTRGKGYRISDDGLSYSYSVFNDYDLIKSHCQSVHLLNTRGSGVNPYRTASHVALLGIKK